MTNSDTKILQRRPTVQGEPVGYVSPRLLDTLRSGKACGITMEDKPDEHNGVTIPLYTAPQPAEQQPEPVSRNLRAVHAMILSALDRDAADGKAVRGEMAAELRSAISEQQSAECTLNADCEQVTEVEAPSHSLPNWNECNLRVGNSKWLKDTDRKAEHDSLTANPLHEFIYEYDDSDAYKSAWFLHRLEKLIDFVRSEQQPAPAVQGECLGVGKCTDQGCPAHYVTAPAVHGPQFLSDEKILEIASNPMVTPCSPWWLKNDVKAGDVQNSAIAFARAVLKAAAPGVQMEVVSWQFYEDGKWWNGDDRIKDHKRNTQEAGYRIRDVYAFSDGPTLVEECPLVKALESIAEYWNQDGNEDAMLNACEYTRSAALAALAAYRKQGGEV